MLFGFKYYLNRAQKHLSRWFFISDASPALGINAGWLFIRTLRLIFNNRSFVDQKCSPVPPKKDAVKPFWRDLKL
jgi:hypothetical protein